MRFLFATAAILLASPASAQLVVPLTTPDGRVITTEDVTPVMMTTTVVQTRRDCLFYVSRRVD